jgi:hypothetical protein
MLVRNLLEGQYENPVRIVAFNTADGWPLGCDRRYPLRAAACYVKDDDVAESLLTFMEAHRR